MAHKNYSKFSETQKKKEQYKPEEVMDVKLTDDTFIPAEVFNCDRLYVRSEPSLESDPVHIVDAGDEVFIDFNKSEEKFYKVTIPKENGENSIEGYCLKDYIIID